MELPDPQLYIVLSLAVALASVLGVVFKPRSMQRSRKLAVALWLVMVASVVVALGQVADPIIKGFMKTGCDWKKIWEKCPRAAYGLHFFVLLALGISFVALLVQSFINARKPPPPDAPPP